MSYEDWKKYMEQYRAEQGKKSVSSWAKAEMEEAVKLGITDGSNPNVLIPRYQAAIMAKRAYEKAKKDILSTLK